jgi:hypothetical protein
MSERDDGGPAFPASWTNESDVNAIGPDGSVVPPSHAIETTGMSLRDYFAARAMLIVMPESVDVDVTDRTEPFTLEDEFYKLCAERAYRLADAMLKARKA